MKPIPASRVLTEFGSTAEPGEASSDLVRKPSRPPEGVPERRNRSVPSTDKMPSVIEDAFRRGREEGRAAGLAELEVRLEEQRQFLEKQQEIERYTWATREMDVLVEQLRLGLRDIETIIAVKAARILKPFLLERVRVQAVSELSAALESLLTKGEGIQLEISGPEDLLQLLRARLTRLGDNVKFSPSAGADIHVGAGQTILETRLAAWVAKLNVVVNE